MMQARRDSVSRCRAIGCDATLESKRAGSTPRLCTLALVIACVEIAALGQAFAQISSFPAAPVEGRIARTLQALEQPPPDGSHATVSPSLPGEENCGRFERNTYLDTICLQYGWPHGHLAQADGFQVEEISSPSGRAIPIKITLPNDVRDRDAAGRGPVFLMFRGLPPEITLSAGFRQGDAWAVSLRDVPDLIMSSPPGYQGSYTLTVTLHKGQNISPETRVIAVHLTPAAAQDRDTRTRSVQSTAAASKPSPDSVAGFTAGTVERLGAGEETTLLQNAAEMLTSGDIEAARLVYSELATHGSGKAAFLMAQTYDPQVLEEHFVVGMEPNSQLAREWYSRAAELGESEAKERLRTLQQK